MCSCLYPKINQSLCQVNFGDPDSFFVCENIPKRIEHRKLQSSRLLLGPIKDGRRLVILEIMARERTFVILHALYVLGVLKVHVKQVSSAHGGRRGARKRSARKRSRRADSTSTIREWGSKQLQRGRSLRACERKMCTERERESAGGRGRQIRRRRRRASGRGPGADSDS
jgi:hypothetical protein